MDTEPRQKPIPDKGAHDTDKEVAKYSESRPPNDFTSQPARDDADEQNDQQALVRHMHWSPLYLGQAHPHRRNGYIIPVGNASPSPQFLDPDPTAASRS